MPGSRAVSGIQEFCEWQIIGYHFDGNNLDIPIPKVLGLMRIINNRDESEMHTCVSIAIKRYSLEVDLFSQ